MVKTTEARCVIRHAMVDSRVCSVTTADATAQAKTHQPQTLVGASQDNGDCCTYEGTNEEAWGMTQMRVPARTAEDTIHDIAGQLRDTLPGTVTSYLVIADASRIDDYANVSTTGATISSAGLNSQQRISMLEKALEHERQQLAEA